MKQGIYRASIAALMVALVGNGTVAAGQSRITGTGKIYPSSSSESSAEEGEKGKLEAEKRIQPQAEDESEASNQPQAEEGETSSRPRQVEHRSLEKGGRLDLVCGGAGSANRMDNATITGDVYANVYSQRSQGFGDQVALYIQGDEGRLRMPRAMLPPVRGGEDGWFKLGDIRIKENEITATVRVNFMNNPKMRIDRYTGGISISGKAGDYSGQCQRIVREETQKQF